MLWSVSSFFSLSFYRLRVPFERNRQWATVTHLAPVAPLCFTVSGCQLPLAERHPRLPLCRDSGLKCSSATIAPLYHSVRFTGLVCRRVSRSSVWPNSQQTRDFFFFCLVYYWSPTVAESPVCSSGVHPKKQVQTWVTLIRFSGTSCRLGAPMWTGAKGTIWSTRASRNFTTRSVWCRHGLLCLLRCLFSSVLLGVLFTLSAVREHSCTVFVFLLM